MNSTSAQATQIEIVVNGQTRAVPEGLSLDQLLRLLDIDPARVAVEMNKAIVRRVVWSDTPVTPGSTFEIVQFVGGG
jgi:thiamine biosynthesis protein ThiS